MEQYINTFKKTDAYFKNAFVIIRNTIIKTLCVLKIFIFSNIDFQEFLKTLQILQAINVSFTVQTSAKPSLK